MGMTQEKMKENLAREGITLSDEEKGRADPKEKTGQEKGPEDESQVLDEKEQRYVDLLGALPLSDQEKFKHKREQVYLMVMQDLGDAFIKRVVSLPYLMIDRLRMATMVAGEEKVFAFLSGNTDRAITEDAIMELVKTPAPEQEDEEQKPEQPDQQGQAEPVAKTDAGAGLDAMGAYMVRQQQIAADQMDRLLAYASRINDLFARKAKEDVEEARQQQASERAEYKEKIETLEDENFRLSMELAQENAKKDLLEKEARQGASGTKQKPDGAAGDSGQPGKEDKKREAFITSLFSDNRFNDEQMQVIGGLGMEKLSLAQLKKICNPKVPAKNMVLLAAYYNRRSQ